MNTSTPRAYRTGRCFDLTQEVVRIPVLSQVTHVTSHKTPTDIQEIIANAPITSLLRHSTCSGHVNISHDQNEVLESGRLQIFLPIWDQYIILRRSDAWVLVEAISPMTNHGATWHSRTLGELFIPGESQTRYSSGPWGTYQTDRTLKQDIQTIRCTVSETPFDHSCNIMTNGHVPG